METVSLALTMIIGVVLLSASVTGFFIRRLNIILRMILAVLALGAFILCAHRDLVAQPATLMAATAIILTFLFWVFVQRRRLNPVTIAD